MNSSTIDKAISVLSPQTPGVKQTLRQWYHTASNIRQTLVLVGPTKCGKSGFVRVMGLLEVYGWDKRLYVPGSYIMTCKEVPEILPNNALVVVLK